MNIFKTKSGKTVIGQKPNAPLVIAIIAYLGTLVPFFASAHRFFDLIFFGSLFTWSWLEITQGVNVFRRILGVVVLCSIIFLRMSR